MKSVEVDYAAAEVETNVPVGVDPAGQQGTNAAGTCCAIGPNVGDKNQTTNGMLWDRNVIISQEKARGKGSTEKEGCTAFIEEGRQTGTQASCPGDVVRQIGGHSTRGGQGNTRELAHPSRDNQGLTNDAARIPDGWTGTSYNQTKRNLIGQAVKSNDGGNRAGKKYISYLRDISKSVSNYISRMQGALLVLISAYVWNQGQASPLVGDNQPLPSKYSVQLFDCGVPGKIQMLQIPETCEDKSTERERAQLRETYVLSPRKLKKTTGVMCRAVVSDF